VVPGPTSSADPQPTPDTDGTDTEPGAPGDAPVGAAPPPVGADLPQSDGGSFEPTAPMPQPVPVGPAPGRPAPNPTGLSPFDVLGSVVTGAVLNVGMVIQPAAALAVASEFTFPLALAIAVLLYLVVQDQVDRRDPKLRAAPRTNAETLIRFEPEE
jgi:hypothetical protein